jgi:hypothetical protein
VNGERGEFQKIPKSSSCVATVSLKEARKFSDDRELIYVFKVYYCSLLSYFIREIGILLLSSEFLITSNMDKLAPSFSFIFFFLQIHRKWNGNH